MSQENSIDSIQITKIVRLINDYKACVEYSEEIEERLTIAKEVLSRTVKERNEYLRLFDEVDNALNEMTARKNMLEMKLKRTRRIGVIGSIGGFFVGVFIIILI